jgi:ribonuclease HII
VAAASIIAKVARDNYMQLQHQVYPQYRFDLHVGYGTALHLETIKKSLSPLHRRSFAPIRLAAQVV